MPKRVLLILGALAYLGAAALFLALVPAPHSARPTPWTDAQPVLAREEQPAPLRTPGRARAEDAPYPPGPPLARGVFDYAQTYHSRCSVLLSQVPALAQERNLSCEAAAIRMVLAGRGLVLAEETIVERMPCNPNPHLGFRGQVDGELHQEEMGDYGAYAEVVAAVLASFGAPAAVRYGMGDAELAAAVRGGSAVIVWMTRQPEPKIIEAAGYRLVAGEHVQVVVGLGDGGGFLVHDPWGARPDSGRLGTVLVPEIQQWGLFGRMAVVVPLAAG